MNKIINSGPSQDKSNEAPNWKRSLLEDVMWKPCMSKRYQKSLQRGSGKTQECGEKRSLVRSENRAESQRDCGWWLSEREKWQVRRGRAGSMSDLEGQAAGLEFSSKHRRKTPGLLRDGVTGSAQSHHEDAPSSWQENGSEVRGRLCSSWWHVGFCPLEALHRLAHKTATCH